jgi:hypothetical protein
MRGASTKVQAGFWGAAAIVAVCALGCSAGEGNAGARRDRSGDTAGSGGGGSGDPGGAVGAGTGGATGTGPGTGTGTAPPILEIPDAGRDAAFDPDAACTGEMREGERLPLDMYFVLDQSGSMSDDVQGGTKWKVVSDSLVGFMNDPANADIGAGIGYFPATPPACMQGDPGCVCIPFVNICFATMGGSCTATDYATPSIPLSLPPNHPAVVADIAKHKPGGGTPTRPALEGAMQYVASWATSNPGRKVVVVLATDGDPAGCSQNSPQDVANVAAAALGSQNSIQTFVIGVGSSLTSLNLVAQAGGTNMAYLVDTGGSVGQAFTAALNAIRGQATPCDFTIPAQTSQGPVDPQRVNVSFTPRGATQAVPVPMTQGGLPANCGANGGWYYDNPMTPKTVKLCDATCQSLQGGKVQLEFGCKTIVSVN